MNTKTGVNTLTQEKTMTKKTYCRIVFECTALQGWGKGICEFYKAGRTSNECAYATGNKKRRVVIIKRHTQMSL
jgi:hypothetical protein